MSEYTFINLGHFGRELREFVKDIRFRNRMEEEESKLRILKAKLDTLERYPVSREELGLKAGDLRIRQFQLPLIEIEAYEPTVIVKRQGRP